MRFLFECESCDVTESFNDDAEALAAGWTRITADDGAATFWYCPRTSEADLRRVIESHAIGGAVTREGRIRES